MFNKFKETAKEKLAKPDLNELLFNAKKELAKAKHDNETVIIIEKGQLKHYQEQKSLGRSGFEEAENNSKMKLKKAYYALYAIRETEYKLADVYSTSLFYSAMNKYTSALNNLNRIKAVEKPKINKFDRTYGKAFSDGGFAPNLKDTEKIERMYEASSISIDDIVDDEVINDITNGKSVKECLGNYVGVKCTYDDFTRLDGFGQTDIYNDDLSNADFSSLQDN